MRLRGVILIWGVCFVGMLALFVGWNSSQSKANSRIPVAYFVVENEKIVVVRSGQLGRSYSAQPIAQVGYQSLKAQGPIAGLIEVYETTSCFEPGTFVLHDRGTPLSVEQSDQIYATLITYALADPEMAIYRPGQAATTRFVPRLLTETLLRMLLLISLPSFITWLAHRAHQEKTSVLQSDRRAAGVCIHCTYPCADLAVLTCPECGKFHTTNYQPPSETILESNA